MKVLNENTRKVLGQLSNLNTICVVDYPVMSMKSDSENVVAFFNTKLLGENEFDAFGVFNISELLSIVNLTETPDIELEDGIITIKDDKTKIKYITTDLGILGDYTRIKPSMLERTKSAETVLSFELNNTTMAQIKKASDVFKNLESLIITGKKGNDITVSVGESSKKIKNSNSYTMKVNGEVKEDTTVILDVKNFKIIPTGTYEVQIKYNREKDAYRVIMSSKDIDTLEFILAVN